MPEPVFLSPNPNIQNANPTQSDHQPENDQIPLDPLLGSGTFIHVDNNAGQNGDFETITPQPIRAVRAGSEVEAAADPGSAPGLASEETPASQRKGRRPPEEMAERPSWLPENWKMELRVRTSGATAGAIDRYYVDPVSGRKFRSKNEVVYFLETGSKRKRKLTSDADAMPSESGGGSKPKKSKPRIGDFSGLNFDFRNPPQNLSWVLTSASQDKWMPFGAEGMMPEPLKREWDKAFSCVSQLEQHSRPAN